MKIYLCGRYGRRTQFWELRDRLKHMGHEVTSRWIDVVWEGEGTPSSSVPEKYREQCAKDDLYDVGRADCLVAFTEYGQQGSNRGGRHVELGYAIALGKRIIVVGEPENIFHHHPSISMILRDVEALINQLLVDRRNELEGGQARH